MPEPDQRLTVKEAAPLLQEEPARAGADDTINWGETAPEEKIEKKASVQDIPWLEARVAKNLAYGLLGGYGALILVAMIYSMVNPANGLEVLKILLSTLTPLVGVVLGYYFTKK